MVEHFGSAFCSVEDFFQETFANHAQAGFGAVGEGRNLMQGELARKRKIYVFPSVFIMLLVYFAQKYEKISI